VNSIGALVEQVPHQPPVAPTKNVATTQNTLVIDYMHLEGTADGGSQIINYNIQWDQGENIKEFVDLQTNMFS
jgi:hypothetical protein